MTRVDIHSAARWPWTIILLLTFPGLIASGCRQARKRMQHSQSKAALRPAKTAPRPAPASQDNEARTKAPAARPKPAGAAPKVDLDEACRARAAWLRKRVPRRFRVLVSPPYVVAGNLGRTGMAYQLRRGVLEPARALHASYFTKRPERPITILLLGSFKTYAKWAKKLFGDHDVPYFGYFKPGIRTMIMNIGPGIGTLWHELTHALMAVDFPAVPDWFNEGLASLHEGAYYTRRRFIGVTNWRFPALRRALRAGKLRPLRDLITKDDFYTNQSGLNYAQARFFVQFMQTKKVLRKFYRHFRDHPGKDLGLAAVEHVFGYRIARIDKEYRYFLRRIRYRR